MAKSNDKTRSMIEQCSGFSGTLESILLALLHNQDQLEQSLLAARHESSREAARFREELDQEAQQREAAEREVRALVADGLSRATGDIAAQVEALKGEVGELADQQASNHKALGDNLDKLSNGLNDKVDANLAEVVKLVNDESERLCREAGRVEGEMKEEMAALRSNLTNVEADVAAKARQDSDGQQRQLGELKMALEEEKMLRGQDNEILKLSLQQGVADLNGQGGNSIAFFLERVLE